MKFSIIYTFDVEEGTRPPEKQRRVWRETEHDGTHRKKVAILNRRQFDEFIDHCVLYADSTETMGSIGAPGFGIGWAPAISFISTDTGANAYVTPVPDVPPRGELKNIEHQILTGEEYEEKCWQRIRKAVLSVYG